MQIKRQDPWRIFLLPRLLHHGHPGTVSTNKLLRYINIYSKWQTHQCQVFPITLLLWTQIISQSLSKLLQTQTKLGKDYLLLLLFLLFVWTYWINGFSVLAGNWDGNSWIILGLELLYQTAFAVEVMTNEKCSHSGEKGIKILKSFWSGCWHKWRRRRFRRNLSCFVWEFWLLCRV